MTSMHYDAEKYLLDLFINESAHHPLNIADILPTMRSMFGVSDKQVYATLFKWSRKGIINYGVSINVPWLEDVSKFNRDR